MYLEDRYNKSRSYQIQLGWVLGVLFVSLLLPLAITIVAVWVQISSGDINILSLIVILGSYVAYSIIYFLCCKIVYMVRKDLTKEADRIAIRLTTDNAVQAERGGRGWVSDLLEKASQEQPQEVLANMDKVRYSPSAPSSNAPAVQPATRQTPVQQPPVVRPDQQPLQGQQPQLTPQVQPVQQQPQPVPAVSPNPSPQQTTQPPNKPKNPPVWDMS